jgi:hypothetical protein
MATYCYTLSRDGAERALPSAEFATEADAIAHGRRLLEAELRAPLPAAAYVAVFEDEGADDEPLGAWDWSGEAPQIVWSGAE